MIKKLVVTGCTEAILLTVAAMLKPQFFQDNAIWIVVGAALVLLLVAIYDHIKNKGVLQAAKATGGMSQATTGDASHNFHRVGTVNINALPPAPEVAAPVAPREIRPEPLPDLPLEAVVARLYHRAGDISDEIEGALEALELSIEQSIRDAAHQGLHVWGRRQPKFPPELVWREAWARGQFSLPKNEVVYRSPDNPRSPFRWCDLMFNSEEVDKKWPPPFDPRAIVA